MSHVRIRMVAIALGLVSLCGCSGSSGEKDRAAGLYAQADSALNAGQFVMAKALLDSLDSTCPAEVEVRRKGMALMARIREGMTQRELELTDSMLVVTMLRNDSITASLKKVANDIEPYYVVAGQGDITPGTLTARLTPDGDLYIISCVGSGHGHTSVSVSDGVESASTVAVAYDGERNDRSGGVETVHYLGAECDSLAKFIASRQGQALNVTFNGRKPYRTSLTSGRAASIASLYNLSKGIRDVKALSLKKEGLEKQLAITRTQLARTAE